MLSACGAADLASFEWSNKLKIKSYVVLPNYWAIKDKTAGAGGTVMAGNDPTRWRHLQLHQREIPLLYWQLWYRPLCMCVHAYVCVCVCVCIQRLKPKLLVLWIPLLVVMMWSRWICSDGAGGFHSDRDHRLTQIMQKTQLVNPQGMRTVYVVAVFAYFQWQKKILFFPSVSWGLLNIVPNPYFYISTMSGQRLP